MQEPFKLEVVSVRLVRDAPLFSDHKIISPADAVKVVGDFLCEMDREVLCVINLKSDGTPINCNIVSIGAVNQSIAEPRELFEASILSNAAQMIIVHNHPSGSLEPSKIDIMLTDRMLKLTDLMGNYVDGSSLQVQVPPPKNFFSRPSPHLALPFSAAIAVPPKSSVL